MNASPVIHPEYLEALQMYLNNRIQPGGFLLAVLSNDLFEAIGRADDRSMANLEPICRYVYNHLPAKAWGSREKVDAHLGGL